jgi:hypothetical protein
MLLEVGRPGASGYHLTTGISGNQVVFGRIILEGLQPNEVRIFQISNIRINARAVPGPTQLTLSVSGAIVENGTPIVAETVPGLKFELRNGDGSEWGGPPNFSATNGLTLTKLATFRFKEGFAGAFKTRAPIVSVGSGRNYATSEDSESHALPALVQTPDGGLNQAGVADSGTRLKVVMRLIPRGVKLFASASDTSRSFGLKAEMVVTESSILLEETQIDGEPVYGVEIMEGEGWEHPSATLTWELVHAKVVARRDEPGFLDFTLYACCAPDPDTSIGTAMVNGCFAPTSLVTAASSKAPIPRFIDTSSAKKLFTIVP